MKGLVDAVVIGGGPAGSAAAIRLAEAGCSCLLLERDVFPRTRPGEALHPGIEPLLRQLGAWDAASALSTVRPSGVRISTERGAHFEAFGGDASGAWRGLQVARADLDEVLVGQARRRGVLVMRQHVRALTVTARRVSGVVTANGAIGARIVIDAAGGHHLLARLLRLRVERQSPTLLAAYGYAEGVLPAAERDPHFGFDRTGWTWVARVGPSLTQWTRLETMRGLSCPPAGPTRPPAAVAALPAVGRPRGADVTWRRVSQPAGRGYFIAGDAAAVIDPASSDGVIRALMAGRLAGDFAAHVLTGAVAEDSAATAYSAWVRDTLDRRIALLDRLYSRMFPGWRESRQCALSHGVAQRRLA